MHFIGAMMIFFTPEPNGLPDRHNGINGQIAKYGGAHNLSVDVVKGEQRHPRQFQQRQKDELSKKQIPRDSSQDGCRHQQKVFIDQQAGDVRMIHPEHTVKGQFFSADDRQLTARIQDEHDGKNEGYDTSANDDLFITDYIALMDQCPIP